MNMQTTDQTTGGVAPESQRDSQQRLARQPDSTERVKKEWWAVVDGGVTRVTGYSCAPNNPDMWWCPSVGYSMSEKHHLFERECDALRKAVAEAEREAMKWTEIVKKLKARLPSGRDQRSGHARE